MLLAPGLQHDVEIVGLIGLDGGKIYAEVVISRQLSCDKLTLRALMFDDCLYTEEIEKGQMPAACVEYSEMSLCLDRQSGEGSLVSWSVGPAGW